MLLFQIFGAIIRLFIGSLTALILFPLWLLLIIATSPLRILSPSAHSNLNGSILSLFMRLVFLDFKTGRNR
jgi:hypothetical protein